MEKDYILYVDDESINIEIFKAFMENEYHVITETSTSRAFELLKVYPFKVIVSDQRMPEETGLAFLQRVHPIYPDISKIIFTAFIDNETTVTAINQGGIYKFLKKPWDTNEMNQALKSAITEYNLKVENKHLIKELQQKNAELEIAFSAIAEKERKFHNIFSNSNDGIVIIKGQEIMEANRSFVNLIDFPNQEVSCESLNQFVNRKYPHLITKPIQQIGENEHSILELEIITGNQKKKSFQLNTKKIIFDGCDAILTIVRDITQQKQLDLKILNAIVRTQEEDQTRYARELHDGIGPVLSTLKMYIEWLANEKNTVNKPQIMRQTVQGIDDAIVMLKDIANNLSPHILQNFGLTHAIQTFANKIQNTQKIEVIISSNINERLPENEEIHLYRILTECLNNSIKHGNPKKIMIKFNLKGDKLSIHYSDNGKGFDVEDILKNKKGMGLFNIKNRIKLLGGEIDIISNINVGTDIKINLTIK
jgi:PAS domain S-box-containing protein